MKKPSQWLPGIVLIAVLFTYKITYAQPAKAWQTSYGETAQTYYLPPIPNDDTYAEDWVEHVIRTSDGGYIGAGYSTKLYIDDNNRHKIPSVIKYAADGTVQWTNRFDEGDATLDGQGQDIVELDGDGYVMLSYKAETSGGQPKPFLTHIGYDGSEINSYFLYDGTSYSADQYKSRSLRKIPGGGFIIAGFHEHIASSTHHYGCLIKVNADFTFAGEYHYQYSSTNSYFSCIGLVYSNGIEWDGTPHSSGTFQGYIATGTVEVNGTGNPSDIYVTYIASNMTTVNWSQSINRSSYNNMTTPSYTRTITTYNPCTSEALNSSADGGAYIAQIEDGDFVLTADFDKKGGSWNCATGVAGDWNESDGVLIKLNKSNGQPQWIKNVVHISGPDYHINFRTTSNGDFIICGTNGDNGDNTTSNLSGDPKFFVVKTDNSGTIEWSKKFDDGNDEVCCFDVELTLDGGCVAVGNNCENNDDYLAIKLNKDCQTGVFVLDSYPDASNPSSTITVSDQTLAFLGQWDIYGEVTLDNCDVSFFDTKLTNDFDNVTNPTRIIIHEGGMLNLINGTSLHSYRPGLPTNTCKAMWDGIEILGNSTSSQPTSKGGASGILNINTSSSIEDAHIGVEIGGGGVINADNAIFKNCRNGIIMWDYHDGTNANISSLTGCTFDCDGPLPVYAYFGEGVETHITLQGIKAVNMMQGCTLKNSLVSYPCDHLGTGIKATNCFITSNVFSGTLTCSTCSCYSAASLPSANVFQNLDIGIMASTDNTLTDVAKLWLNQFYNVKQGIYIHNYYSPDITLNYFN